MNFLKQNRQALIKTSLVMIVLGLIFVALPIYLSPRNDLEEADLVVAISGGDTKSRTLVAVEIYKKGWAPRVAFSGAAMQEGVISNAEAMRNIAVDAGVPSEIIFLSENAENTKQNANEISQIIKQLSPKKIILVTSEYHQRRASINFRSQLEAAGINNAKVINYPAREDGWSRAGWWTNLRGIMLTASEGAKTAIDLINTRF